MLFSFSHNIDWQWATNQKIEPQPPNERQKIAELFPIENPNISLVEKDQVHQILARQENLFATGKKEFWGIHNVN